MGQRERDRQLETGQGGGFVELDDADDKLRSPKTSALIAWAAPPAAQPTDVEMTARRAPRSGRRTRARAEGRR